MNDKQTIRILVADDDADDRMLIAEAFEEAQLNNPVDYVHDGIDLLEFLRREGTYENRREEPLPGIILLDLNMPRLDGRGALMEIRKDPELRKIPVVILTTSQSDEDIIKSYDLGVNSFITKPVTFGGLVDVIRVLNRYWIEIVSLPA